MELPQKKLKIDLPYDPAIPHLDIYLEKIKTLIQKDMHPNVHSSTVYNSKDMETKCPSTDEWIRKMWDTLSHKKE